MARKPHLWQRILLGGAVALCVACSFSLATAETYYVTEDGNDNNDGSAQNPWATIHHAISRAGANDVISVANGTYYVNNESEQIVFGRDRAGLTVISPDRGAIIDVSRATNWSLGNPVVILNGDDQVLDGVTVQGGWIAPVSGTPPVNRGIGIGGPARDRRTHNATVRNCVSRYNGHQGMRIINTENVTVTNCQIYGNGWGPQDDYYHGIYVEEITYGGEFTDNIVYGNGEIQMHVNGWLGGYDNTGIQDFNIRRCIFFGRSGWRTSNYLGDFQCDTNVLLENCLLLGSSWRAHAVNTANFVNNTVICVHKGEALTWGDLTKDSQYLIHGVDGKAFNNVAVSLTSPGVLDPEGANYRDENSNYFIDYDGANATELLNNLFVNYQEVDMTAHFGPLSGPIAIQGDYRLKEGSPAYSDRDNNTDPPRGVPTFMNVSAPAIDKDSNQRPSPTNGRYDIGAYEFLSGDQKTGFVLDAGVNGNGIATKSPDKALYDAGEQVVITAVPDNGWSFVNWTGDVTGTTNPVTVTVQNDMAVTANFTQGQYTLDVDVNGGGTVTKNPDKTSYDAGEQVIVGAFPDDGWSFVNWTGDVTGTTNPVTVTVQNNMTLTANFSQDHYTLSVNVDGNGTVNKTPDQQDYVYGDEIELFAEPDQEWVFTGWSGGLTGTDNPATLIVTGDTYVTAQFDLYVPTPLVPPQSVGVTEGTLGCALVSWERNSEPDVSRYVVYWSSLSVEQGDADQYADSLDVGNRSNEEICGFEQGTYFFAVRAVNRQGDYSAFSDEARLDAEGPDLTPPSITAIYPGDGDVEVNPTVPEIQFTVADNGVGVDESSISVTINGQSPADVTINGDSSEFMVGCAPNGDLPANEEVTVRVEASDLASPPNPVEYQWSFATAAVEPSMPTGFVATGTDTGSVVITWNSNPEPDISGYTVYYGTASVALGQVAEYENSVPVGDVTHHTIRGLTDGTYYVSLRARNTSGLRSEYAPEAVAHVTTPVPEGPNPPQLVQAAETAPGCVTLTWQRNSETDVAGYVVYYGTQSVEQGQAGDYTTSMDVGNNTSYEICLLNEGPHYFAVKAYNTSDLYSEYSTEQRVDVIGPDNVPPSFSQFVPGDGETNVGQNASILFMVSDDKSGINPESISVQINGFEQTSVQYMGIPSAYTVVVQPDELLPSNQTIRIDVSASDLASPPNSENASWVFTTGDSRPAAPVNLTAGNTGTGCAELSWNPVSSGGVVGYTIYYGTESVPGQAAAYQDSLEVGNVTGEEICGLAGVYYFAVRARNNLGLLGPLSSEVALEVTNEGSEGPSPPQQVHLLETSPGCVSITWRPNTEPDIAGYVIYYGPIGQSPGQPGTLDVGNSPTGQVCGFEQGIYFFMVRAYNTSMVFSDYSTEKRVTVIGPDFEPPKIVIGGPRSDAVGVSPASNVFFAVSDEQSGVDKESLSVSINGAPPDKVRIVGDLSSYAVVCTPGGEFEPGAVVEVVVEVSDFALTPNTATAEWQFTVAGGPPSTPTGLVATADISGCLSLQWNANPENDISGYVICYGPSSVAGGDATHYADTLFVGPVESHAICNLPESRYYAAICARNHFGMVSEFSEEVSAEVRVWDTGTAQPPLPPQNVSLSGVVDGCLTVAWDANPEPDIAGYVVCYGTVSVSRGGATEYENERDVGLDTSLDICDLPEGRFYLAVRAYNTSNEYSAYSAEQAIGEEFVKAEILPDGYWAQDANRPLEVRNVPRGWTVKIFSTDGFEIRSFKNDDADGVDWTWDFTNDHGRRVAKSLYLIRILDDKGDVVKDGRFVVQSDA